MAATLLTNTNFPKFLDISPSHQPHTSFSISAQFGIDAQQSAIRQYGIAGRVWEAAYAMLIYMHPPTEFIFDPPSPFLNSNAASLAGNPYTVVELGSGTGMVAAALGTILDPHKDMVIATDLPEVCPLLEKNLRANEARSTHLSSRAHSDLVVVRPLTWGNEEHCNTLASEFFFAPKARTLTHIVCSDLVYFPELLAPLLRTLIHLTSSSFITAATNKTQVLISYKIRSLSKETPFWSAFGLWFEYRPVLAKRINVNAKDKDSEVWQRFGAGLDDDMFIFIARRRPESVTWVVPSNDQALLDGVGAWGNDRKKGDDTFESLLLMSLD